MKPPTPCPRCGSTKTVIVKCDSGPRYARVNCAACGAYIKWHPKPRVIEE